MTTSETRRTSSGRALLWVPVALAPACLIAAAPLLGGEHDFWGFLLALIGGWLAAVVVVGLVMVARPLTLSVVLHVALAIAFAALLWPLVQTAALGTIPVPVRGVVGMATPPAAGWVWLTLLGRITGAVDRGSARRAAALVPAEWQQVTHGWSLRLWVSPVRRRVFSAAIVTIGLAAAAALSTFVLVFSGLAQRMSPMVMLFLLGWILGMPAYLLIRGIVRARTVAVDLRIEDGSVRVRSSDDAVLLFDIPLAKVRRLAWMSGSAPTRIELTPAVGEPIVLLVGMARRPKDASPALPPIPPELRRTLENAGLRAATPRPARDRGVVFERK